MKRRSDIHYPKPRAVSLTQATEVGTVYSAAELHAIGEVARKLDLRVHMDGARFANALASLNCRPREITWEAGVDVLCFGGTKNGMAVGDAVVFFNLEMAREFDYRCKQAGQLASKMRFLSAPWVGVLKDGRGNATPATPTAWPASLRANYRSCPACRSSTRARPTWSSSACPRTGLNALGQRLALLRPRPS